MQGRSYSDILMLAANRNVKERDYWLAKLSGDLTKTGFPKDFKTSEKDAGKDRVKFTFSGELFTGLKRLSKESDYALYMILTAQLVLLLHKYSGNSDIIVGAPIYKQEVKEDFVNTVLVLRNKIKREMTFRELLLSVKETVNEAEENQNYPIEVLTPRLNLFSFGGASPLFDVAVVVENIHDRSYLSHIKPDTLFSFTRKDDEIACRLEFNPDLFEKTTMERVILHARKLLHDTLSKPDIKICEVELLSQEEKKQLSYDFNDTEFPFPAGKAIHRLFEEQAVRTPDNIALTVQCAGQEMQRGESRDQQVDKTYGPCLQLTYKQLDREANSLTLELAEKGAGSGVLVGIMVERSIEMVIGIFAILKSGAAYLPIEPGYPAQRKRYILNDSSAGLLIITGNLRSAAIELDDWQGETVFIDSPAAAKPGSRSQAEVGAEARVEEKKRSSRAKHSSYMSSKSYSSHPAYVIYTSGSTGKPKGVLVEHKAAVNILTALQRKYPLEESGVYLFKTSYMFDVSVTELFGWFFAGGRLAILEPGAEKYPRRIVDAIANAAVTHINFVPSMFNVFVDELDSRNIHKLSTLKYIFAAGEALLPEPVKKFQVLNTGIRLENIYGPTEGTVYACGYSLAKWEGSGSVPIGKPMQNIQLYILDKYDSLLPVGVPGELCISGAGLARGYLNNPELSAEKFPFDLCKPGPSPKPQEPGIPGRIYKTGDLTRWLPDGSIEYLGRMDRQVKIRGFRVELGEIENRLLKHPGIKEAVVTAGESPGKASAAAGEKYLCAYVVFGEAETGSAQTAIVEPREFLSQSLPGYMVPAHFVEMERIPLTASGKIDRKALPKPETGLSRAKYSVPKDETQKKLVEIWAEILGAPAQTVGIDDNFFERGGHSLSITRLTGQVYKRFDIDLPYTEVFENPTIRGLSGYIERAGKSRFSGLERAQAKDYYSLSAAQKRLYILQQMGEGETFYNMPIVVWLSGALDKERFAGAFRKMINRHESLRTSFAIKAGEPVQMIHEPVDIEFELEYYTTGSKEQGAGNEEIIKTFIRPFDLSRAPLLRVGLINREKNKNLLLADMHHIISDGLSLGIFLREFPVLYAGEELAPLNLQYKDYSEWQNNEKGKESIKKQEQYWQEQFAGEIPVLNLPTDFPRPAIQSFAGSAVDFTLCEEETAALNEMAAKYNATLFMVLLTIFNLSLSKISGREDIVIGTPIAGRRHPDLSGIIGMFVNTLALRNYPLGGKTFEAFLVEVRSGTLKAFENQDYQFEDLVEFLALTRDAGRNPLFDVMFTLQSLDPASSGIPRVDIPDLKLEPYKYENEIAKFDLTLNVRENADILSCNLSYCTKLFTQETVERCINYFKKVVTAVLKDPRAKIFDIEIISPEEKREILYSFNNRETKYPIAKTIHGLFEEQAAAAPDSTALVSNTEVGGRKSKTGDVILTYKELNEKSNRLALLLQETGLAPGDTAGIIIERSIEMIVGITAVLKTGAAYLPMSPKNPRQRNNYMLRDSSAKLLLTSRSLSKEAALFENWPGQTVYLDDPVTDKAGEPGISTPVFYSSHMSSKSYSSALPGGSPLAYIIYTSGSTGIPKGVPITHANFCPLIHWGYKHLELDAAHRVVQNLSYFFDWSVWEIFITLTTGASLYIVSEELMLDSAAYVNFINRKKITVLHSTPSQYQVVIGTDSPEPVMLSTLKHLCLGAERLTGDLLKRSYETVSEDCRIYNMYGPTEATIISAVLEIDKTGEGYRMLSGIPIGIPVANAVLLVLDKGLRMCPVNVSGELYIAGDGLAPGYLNDPEKSAKSFVRNIFENIEGDYLYKTGEGAAPPPSKNLDNRLSKLTGHRSPITLYRTGDRCRWLPGGSIEFLDRIDRQVKIRGFRIELGEIESLLLKKKEIKEALVTVYEKESGKKYLCAYIVPGEKIEVQSIRDYLSGELPEYMIPAYFMQLETLPLTPNGKLDRKSLPVPQVKTGTDYIAPQSANEKIIADIWAEVLALEKIGTAGNFFDLGGNSLDFIKINDKLKQVFERDLPLVMMFRYPTVGAFARYLEEENYSLMIDRTAEKKEGGNRLRQMRNMRKRRTS
ncbi:MAG: amino acid adenylation domain-containing protein [Candidatus Aminicenantes bacterium]|nr:amino acid adenylation domain-containing protein [Candidatus Aminicenantes bacterium]